ncbi:MAG TPA: DNA polymerase III subunit delta [Bacteroidales bacterium]|nr:DNA polymerase III subunit delta [Bacteroidales bacterium]HRZ49474.1 DNA polymerase III subunit delta [Bacteroidales bacterium]
MSDYLRIIQQIKSRVLRPVYLLFGEEPYYIDLIAEAVEASVLDESEKEFNQQIFYGYDTEAKQVIAAAKRYPMMANHQVVIVREAHMMKDFEQLQPYFESPQPSTVLVVCYKYKKIDKRKAIYKAAERTGIAYESAKLRDYQLPGWIAGAAREKGYRIQDREALLLAENLGNDLMKISNELEKLCLSIPQGAVITPDIIERNIGISKEYNFFELQSAIARKDVTKATRIALHMAENPKESPLIGIIAVLYAFFSKLLKLHFADPKASQQALASQLGVHPFFLTEYKEAARHFPARKNVEIIELLRTYDLKAKGLDAGIASPSALLRELVFRILH